MTPEQEAARLDLTAAEIERLTGAAFTELLRRIAAGEAPREAIAAIQAGWSAAYQSTLAAAFAEVLGRAVGVAEVRAMPVGEVVLSDRLREHAREVSAVVRGLIAEHARGWHDAHRLAMDIYEGYGFRPREPLAVQPRYVLPKYMRAAFGDDEALRDLMRHRYTGQTLRKLLDDPLTGRPLAEQYARIKTAALKTSALKAAYTQALDGLEKGVGQARLDRLLKTAYYEKQRHFANRIAQTELHRAYVDRQAEELMATERIQFVQWRLSATHPETDICDLHAKVDRYGLGPGVYPKHLAPKPPAHPFCRCMLSPRIDIRPEAKWRENPSAHRVWLREQGISDGAKVMGSRAKLAVALTQAPIEEVINIHRPKPYWVGRVGEGADSMRAMRGELDELPPVPGGMLRGLIAKGEDMRDGAEFATMWTAPDGHQRHLARRIARGDVVDARDYQVKTLDAIRTATSLRVVTPADATMRHTGKLVMGNDAWVVLLSPEGAIVTSYPRIAALESFEQRHLRLGDQLDEYAIGPQTRARLADVFR